MKFRRTNKVGKFEVKKVKNKGAVSKNVVRVAISPRFPFNTFFILRPKKGDVRSESMWCDLDVSKTPSQLEGCCWSGVGLRWMDYSPGPGPHLPCVDLPLRSQASLDSSKCAKTFSATCSFVRVNLHPLKFCSLTPSIV